ncbi:MAG TPA: LysR family transcriptional regulator [Candidimonas sp.]|nr:LysR family transcriptional regulator [Candidimonas sp.]
MMQSLAVRYFYEVALKGSLSAASESLHVAVSAISRQITTLEQDIGSPLFLRNARGMALTDAGEILLRHVRRSILETDAVRESIASLSGATHSPLRIACIQGLSNDFVPSMLAHFGRLYPHARFRIWVGSAKEATQRVETGEADVALTFSVLPTTPASPIKVLYAHGAPALAVMSQDHPLSRHRRLDIRDLADYTIALTDENSSTYKLYQLASNMVGSWVEPTIYTNRADALHAYVRDSQAILFASYISIFQRLKPNRLVAIPLKNPEMHARTVQVQVMQGRILPDVIEQFLSFAIRRLNDIVQDAPV